MNKTVPLNCHVLYTENILQVEQFLTCGERRQRRGRGAQCVEGIYECG